MALDKSKVNIKVGGDFEALPADKYTAQISDVSLVTQFNKFKGIEEDLLNFQFTILDDKITENGESTKGRLVWQRVSQTLGGRSKLSKLAIAVYGRELTKDEMDSFDPEDLLGKQVDIMVVQNSSSDGTTIYNNISNVSKVFKKLAPIKAVVEPATPIKNKTVAAIAPDAQDPEALINELNKENEEKNEQAAPQTGDSPEELEALEQELRAAELAQKVARARAEAAKKKAVLQG